MTEPDARGQRIGPAQWLALAACLAAFVVIRLPWIGHLLTWDEAMNLCATRSYVNQVQDYYAFWFWTHPPLYNDLLMAVAPLYAGFAERAELVSLWIAVACAAALFALNRRAFGFAPALLACFILAITPASALYDLWIKQEGLVTLLGLFAVILYLRNRIVLAGLALGLAFLSKELAAFYAACLGALWLVSRPRRRLFELFVLFGIAAAVSVSWYIQYSFSLKTSLALATGANIADVADWSRPWYYYPAKLRQDLGMTGLALCGAGLATLGWIIRRARPDERAAVAWPLAFLVPTLLVLQLSHAKAPWFTMTLYPALATLEALGLYGAWTLLAAASARVGWGPSVARVLAVAGLLALSARSAIHFRRTTYEDLLRAQDPGWAWGARASRQAAQTLNALAGAGQRALITPAYYWHDQNLLPDAVFVYYLEDIPVVVRPFTITPDELVETVRKYRLDWAVVSPEPGEGERRLAVPLFQKFGLRPIVLEGAYLFKTTSLYSERGTKGKEKEQ